jgi:hypothetical protein
MVLRDVEIDELLRTERRTLVLSAKCYRHNCIVTVIAVDV